MGSASEVNNGQSKSKCISLNPKLWLNGLIEYQSTSLFFLPMLAVFGAIGGGILSTRFDEYLSNAGTNIPAVLSTTVESARSILSTVAGATISFAGTAFSVSLLVIQLGSSQYSPRIVMTLFRDPFNKRIMALVVGTFTYCLVVMRSVQDDVDVTDGVSNSIVPHISVAIAMVLGIATVLAIVGFIDHAAHSMDISRLLERVTVDAVAQIQSIWVEEDRNDDEQEHENQIESFHSEASQQHSKGIPSNCHVVRFRSSGWVQAIDMRSLEKLVAKEGFIKLHTAQGRYAIPGAPICSVSHLGDDANNNTSDADEEATLDSINAAVQDAIAVGMSRTNRDDAAYGLRQLVDVALRALSPGVNDPTTAQDAIFHAAAVVSEFLSRNPPRAVRKTDTGGELILGEQLTHDKVVLLAYDEVRRCAVSSPTVCLYLLESLRVLRESLKAQGLPKRAPEIERQARLIEKGCALFSHIDEDHELVREARMERFPGDTYADIVKQSS